MIETENMGEAPFQSVYSESKRLDKLSSLENSCHSHGITKYAVVVLTRLPEYKISALRPPTPQQFYSEAESLSSSDSDMQWEPQDDSSDSDYLVMNGKQKVAKGATSKTSLPSTSTNNTGSKLQTPSLIVSAALGHSSNETINVRPNLPEEEIKVDMMVLARKKHIKWQRGKIMELLTKEDGRLKYKISFDEKGKSLVSGHHIAFEHTPKLEQLYVGARVVARCKENKFRFCPGILAELPNRKNRLRFLVFMDDHTPMYVGLPSLHLVCRPLEDSLEDLPDGPHKSFMKQYLKDWPYPHLTQYKPGQTFNAERNGVLQMCEVQVVDSSLIQVTFQDTQQKEWIHRGSIRLEHMTRFLEMKELGSQNKDDSDSE